MLLFFEHLFDCCAVISCLLRLYLPPLTLRVCVGVHLFVSMASVTAAAAAAGLLCAVTEELHSQGLSCE